MKPKRTQIRKKRKRKRHKQHKKFRQGVSNDLDHIKLLLKDLQKKTRKTDKAQIEFMENMAFITKKITTYLTLLLPHIQQEEEEFCFQSDVET